MEDSDFLNDNAYLEEFQDTGDVAFTLLDGNYDPNGEELKEKEETKSLPVLPLRNMVLFPGVLLPVSIGREQSIRLIQACDEKDQYFGTFCQKNKMEDNPAFDDLYPIGTVAKVVRILKMPDNSITAIVRGVKRVKLLNITETEPYLQGDIELLETTLPEESDEDFLVLADTCKDLAIKYIKLSDILHKNAIFTIQNIKDHRFLIDFIISNIPFSIIEKVKLLELNSVLERAQKLLRVLSKEVQLSEIKQKIRQQTRQDIDDQQREYFLQQQIKTIQNELGGSVQEQDVEELLTQAEKMNWDKEMMEFFTKELERLERTNQNSPDYGVQLNYLQTILSLPWGVYTEDNLNLKHAEKVLNRDHYGLEKVKERILEHLAVLQLKKDMKAPIICLYGPPGVGKTSLGKSIAAALNRKYVRMSLGGVHDEAEIRGHRRTYIGAMPGRIIKSLIKAESANPVFVLDEIDKVSADRQGDPSSALLEVLDPEQNTAFHDNYLDLDFDLSKVMFIATANNLNTIPSPLLDRMELIEVSGYITEEKVEIAKRHLIPKEIENNGLEELNIKLPKTTIEGIIESYTRESGVRELEKKINKLLRKLAREYATDGKLARTQIKTNHLHELLGVPEYTKDKYQGNDYAGVVTGLAWTAVGGEILFVESSLSPGKGGKLTLTGNLGDVMKESAMLALEYIKAHSSRLNIDYRIFENWNIHIHVPEGAIPKDGPSAGITMATSIVSSLTQRKVKANVAMTGEITLRGKVLPVGGIKEKILAAKRAGIKEIILSADNKRHIEDIPQIYIKGLKFHYVKDVEEVFDLALTNEVVDNPIDFTIEDNRSK